MEWDEDDDEDDKEGGGLLYDIVAEMVGDWSKGDLPPYNFLQSVLIIVFFLYIFCPRCKKKKNVLILVLILVFFLSILLMLNDGKYSL